MAKDYTLFNIQNGNVCALCEHQLSWYDTAIQEEKPISHICRRAICKPCFQKLCEMYLYDYKEEQQKT